MTEQPLTSPPQLVRDLMTVGVLTCTPGTSVTDLARVMLEKEQEAVIVLDEGSAVGVVDQQCLLRAYTREQAWSLKAEDIMQEGVPQVHPDIPLVAAVQVMLDQDRRALFLMHHSAGIEYPAAVISYRHILRHLAARDGSELRDLGIQAERKSPLDAFRQKQNQARSVKKSIDRR
jgi:predicted transcriptional regulator